MELGANVPDGFRHGTTLDLAFLNFTGTAVNGVAPLLFGVKIHDVIKAGDELMSQKGPILDRKGQHFSDFVSGNAHV
jgi:hypothetical protein